MYEISEFPNSTISRPKSNETGKIIQIMLIIVVHNINISFRLICKDV